MSFGTLRHRIVQKCLPHVQHDYFSPFNQSDHCFLASSLPMVSSLLKLSNREFTQPRLQRQQERGKFVYLTMKNNRFAREVFIFVHFADVLVLSTM